MNNKNFTCPISISKNNLSSALFALLETSLNCPTYNDKNTVSQIMIRKVTIQYTLQKNFYSGSLIRLFYILFYKIYQLLLWNLLSIIFNQMLEKWVFILRIKNYLTILTHMFKKGQTEHKHVMTWTNILLAPTFKNYRNNVFGLAYEQLILDLSTDNYYLRCFGGLMEQLMTCS
jgi:hypothetical protein